MKRDFVTNRANPVTNDHTEPLEDKIARWMSRGNATGISGYYKFLRLYGKIMTRQQAAFLQDLMGRAEMCRLRTKELKERAAYKGSKAKKFPMGDDGFFRCTVRFMLNPRYDSWTADEQKEHFRFLKEIGLVLTQNRRTSRGVMRWVKINYVRVEEELDRAEKIRFQQMCEFAEDHDWKKPKIHRA